MDWGGVYSQREYPKSIEEAKRYLSELEQGDNPYQIDIVQEQNFTRIKFSSLLYADRPILQPNRYILVNNLPESCNGLVDLPYAVVLPGYGAEPEAYGEGFPFMDALIANDTMCCFYGFMPFFFYLPTGGYWYTNNAQTVPELYLFTEVLTVIEHAMGNKISQDIDHRILIGHSMGGFGAVMNSMRTNMRFFGSVCGLNGGLYIWNLPEFQQGVANDVLQEAITRKEGPFINCSYEQPPYRYYADEINFKTMVAVSLAGVFLTDGTTTPKPNSPFFSPTLFNPDCTKYGQFFGFRFWLDENGNLDSSLFNVAPWNSPLGFLQQNYPAVQKELSGNLFLATTLQDEIVNYLENVRFSEELTLYNVSHVLHIYNGTHYDVFEGLERCLIHFAPKVCTRQPSPVPESIEENPIPFWGFLVAACAAGALLIVVFVLSIAHCRAKRADYVKIREYPSDFKFAG